MSEPTAPHEETQEAKADRGWARLLWLSPWILILAFGAYHLTVQHMEHKQARNAWAQDRLQLVQAYLQLKSESESGSRPSDMARTETQDALDHLQDDVRDLDGASDQTSKKDFLDKARNCIAATTKSFNLQQPQGEQKMTVVTPSTEHHSLQPEPMDDCGKLILRLDNR